MFLPRKKHSITHGDAHLSDIEDLEDIEEDDIKLLLKQEGMMAWEEGENDLNA
jgi:hypothetical protein